MRRVAMIAILGCVCVQAVAGQGPDVDQATVAVQLRSSDWKGRRAALDAIVRIPGGNQDRVVLNAVLSELDRVSVLPRLGANEVPAEFDAEAGSDYYGDLLRVISVSKDERVIPYLAKALRTGSGVGNALVAWGERGAAAALDAAEAKPDDPWVVNVTLRFLTSSVEKNPNLSAAVRSRTREFARARLQGRQVSLVVGQALELLGTLRDNTSLAAVTSIRDASSASAAGLILVDEGVGGRTQRFEQVKTKAADVVKSVTTGR